MGNGEVSNLQNTAGDNKTFTAQITPTADGDVTVDVAADVATDLAGNGNTVAMRASTGASRVTDIAVSPAPPSSGSHSCVARTREAFDAVPAGAVHGRNAVLTFTLTFDHAVTVTPDPDTGAEPELELDVFGRKRRAGYTGGSGTRPAQLHLDGAAGRLRPERD